MSPLGHLIVSELPNSFIFFVTFVGEKGPEMPTATTDISETILNQDEDIFREGKGHLVNFAIDNR